MYVFEEIYPGKLKKEKIYSHPKNYDLTKDKSKNTRFYLGKEVGHDVYVSKEIPQVEEPKVIKLDKLQKKDESTSFYRTTPNSFFYEQPVRRLFEKPESFCVKRHLIGILSKKFDTLVYKMRHRGTGKKIFSWTRRNISSYWKYFDCFG